MNLSSVKRTIWDGLYEAGNRQINWLNVYRKSSEPPPPPGAYERWRVLVRYCKSHLKGMCVESELAKIIDYIKEKEICIITTFNQLRNTGMPTPCRMRKADICVTTSRHILGPVIKRKNRRLILSNWKCYCVQTIQIIHWCEHKVLVRLINTA